MSTWVTIWLALLVVTLAGYAVMAVFVTIGGASDLKRMFAALRAGRDGASKSGRDGPADAPPTTDGPVD